MPPFAIGGYVLAGGKSSRMGCDKASLELGGRPLIAWAVSKLRSLCADVRVLSGDAQLAEFAPLVEDLHTGCGPLGGIEAGLADSQFDWNLFVPVDVPFLPAALLEVWAEQCLARKADGAKVCLMEAAGRVQPGICLLHTSVLPFVAAAIARGEFKLHAALQTAGQTLGIGTACASDLGQMGGLQPADEADWFANLNSPEDFAWAEKNLDLLAD
jgi:molybdenum cofactor guanylyltransferase